MTNRRFLRPGLLVAAILVLHWVMAISVSPRHGVTNDEPGHIGAGYGYWHAHDYRLNPENGLLSARWATLPLLAMNLRFPSAQSSEWLRADAAEVGDTFLFELGNPTDAILWRARAMIALASVFTVWLVWRWARGLFGPTAGGIALLLATFCPALLAHGGLATSDALATACLLAALSSIWWLLHRVTWLRLALAIIACAAALLAKMSGLLIVPLAVVMLVARWLRPAPLIVTLRRGEVRWLRGRRPIIAATLALTAASAIGILILLWGAYGFRYSGFNPRSPAPAQYAFSWDVVLEREPLPLADNSSLAPLVPARAAPAPNILTALIAAAREVRLLPEPYLWGLAHTLKFSRERPAYFFGGISKVGWWSFFPTVFVMKTPLPALGLFAAGLAAWLTMAARRRGEAGRPAPRWHRGRLYRAGPLLAFFLLYWSLSIQSSLNIGHRHILPTYPIFYVIASAAALSLRGRWPRLAGRVIAAALALHAMDSALARPFYLAYFQPIFGGVARCYEHFADSSIDWGQGLPDLARWRQNRLKSGDSAPLFLSYAGVDLPRRLGIDATRFGDAVFDNRARSFPAQLRGGWFAISVTQFHRLYLPIRGPWRDRHEQLYREVISRLQAAEAQLRRGETPDPERLRRDAGDYEVMQFGRLTHFLRKRRPDAIVGDSLLVFRLSDAELSQALYGPIARATRLPPS